MKKQWKNKRQSPNSARNLTEEFMSPSKEQQARHSNESGPVLNCLPGEGPPEANTDSRYNEYMSGYNIAKKAPSESTNTVRKSTKYNQLALIFP